MMLATAKVGDERLQTWLRDGGSSSPLKKYGAQGIGIDIDPQRIREATQRADGGVQIVTLKGIFADPGDAILGFTVNLHQPEANMKIFRNLTRAPNRAVCRQSGKPTRENGEEATFTISNPSNLINGHQREEMFDSITIDQNFSGPSTPR